MDVGSFDVERMTSYTVRSSCPRVQRVQVERGQAPAGHVKRIRISECSYINCWGPPNSTMTYSQCPTVHIEIIDVYIAFSRCKPNRSAFGAFQFKRPDKEFGVVNM